MEQTLLITSSAAQDIMTAARQCDVETGGILAGLPHAMVVVAAGKPGPGSVQAPTQFTSDPAEDKHCLYQAKEQLGRAITAVGWWHKHPGKFSRPSSPDVSQAHCLALEYGDGIPVLVGIVNRERSPTRTKTFLAMYGVDRDGTLKTVPWEQVNDNHPSIQEALRKAPCQPEVCSEGYWDRDDFVFYQNPVGRKRITQELAQLKQAGWSVTTSRRKQDRLLMITAVRSDIKSTLILPPEYPLNPPLIYQHNKPVYPEILCRWSSLYSLHAILDSLSCNTPQTRDRS